MKVFDLRCACGHIFEGWFPSEQDYQSQHERGLLACPMCNSVKVEKTLSAPHLQAKSNRQTAAAVPQPQARDLPAPVSPPEGHHGPDSQAERLHASLQALWFAHAREVVKQGDNVGRDFAPEARRIHTGQAPERPIYGQASADQVAELLEEGVPVLPLPANAGESLQ